MMNFLARPTSFPASARHEIHASSPSPPAIAGGEGTGRGGTDLSPTIQIHTSGRLPQKRPLHRPRFSRPHPGAYDCLCPFPPSCSSCLFSPSAHCSITPSMTSAVILKKYLKDLFPLVSASQRFIAAAFKPPLAPCKPPSRGDGRTAQTPKIAPTSPSCRPHLKVHCCPL